MHARVVLGVGKGVLFREVSSVQECPKHFIGLFVWGGHVCCLPVHRGNSCQAPPPLFLYGLPASHTLVGGVSGRSFMPTQIVSHSHTNTRK